MTADSQATDQGAVEAAAWLDVLVQAHAEHIVFYGTPAACKCGWTGNDGDEHLAVVSLSALAEAGYTVVKTGVLREGAQALGEAFKVALTVKPLLDKPYPDDPRWTPWTRWVDRAARRCFNARSALRKAARGPWVPVPEGSADRGSEEGGER